MLALRPILADLPKLCLGGTLVAAFDTSYEMADRLSEITAPTLLIVARQDREAPPAASEELHEGIPNSHLVMIEGSGHFPAPEEEARFSSILAAFLGGD